MGDGRSNIEKHPRVATRIVILILSLILIAEFKIRIEITIKITSLRSSTVSVLI